MARLVSTVGGWLGLATQTPIDVTLTRRRLSYHALRDYLDATDEFTVLTF